MKGFIIYEDYRGKKVVEAVKLGVVIYTCNSEDSDWVSELSGIRKESTQAYCNKDDEYDFETGALIALMKMCGAKKTAEACCEAFPHETSGSIYRENKRYIKRIKELEEENETLKKEKEQIIVAKNVLYNKLEKENEELKSDKDKSWKNYQRNIQKKQDRINELERAYKASNDDKAKLVEYYQREIKKLEAENEKLKLDCEKLCHGYNGSDMIFCGGRQNGKQYTLLVDLFKKLDQNKVDAAYKEAYNTTLPVWQKEVLKQMYDVYEESKEKTELPRTLVINGTVYRKSIQIKDFSNDQLDSLIEGSRAFTRKFDSEWLKPPTKREEMWDKIFELHKESDVIIKVKKEDINAFLHELENKIPEITWRSTVKIFETKYTIGDIYEELKTRDTICFRLSKETTLTYSNDPHNYPYRELKPIDYLPPMRWDLFKKGRLAVKVNYDNYKEFYDACEREIGKKPSTYSMLWDDVTISICKKDGNFEIFNMEHQKKIGRKIVNWEDVR